MSLTDIEMPSDAVEDGDTLPSSGGYLLDTGVHPMKIKAAYTGESSGGAVSLSLILEEVSGNRRLNETIYLTSGRAKGRKAYYERDGKRYPLPGFTLANDLAQVATGQNINDLDTEEKTIKLWQYSAGAEVPTQVDMVMPLIGQVVNVGVVRKKENKPVRTDAGNWVPGPQLKESNEIKKFFNKDGLTAKELAAGDTTPDFMPKWQKRYPSDFVDDSFDPSLAESQPESTPAVTQPSAEVDDDLFAT